MGMMNRDSGEPNSNREERLGRVESLDKRLPH